jgi:hypothetical protein
MGQSRDIDAWRMIFGDYIEPDSRWPKMRQGDLDFAAAVRAAGGTVDAVDLPAAGIKGNSHMLMMDKNNAAVADLIQKWLEAKNLAN